METSQTKKNGRFILWAYVCAALLGCGTVMILIFRSPAAPLTQETLSQAEANWQKTGVKNYQMEIVLSGARTDTHAIEVQDGEVVSMTSNGIPAVSGAWEYWKMEGLYRFLDRELEQSQEPKLAFGVAENTPVTVRTHFNPETGVPDRFFRNVQGEPRLTIEWKITKLVFKN